MSVCSRCVIDVCMAFCHFMNVLLVGGLCHRSSHSFDICQKMSFYVKSKSNNLMSSFCHPSANTNKHDWTFMLELLHCISLSLLYIVDIFGRHWYSSIRTHKVGPESTSTITLSLLVSGSHNHSLAYLMQHSLSRQNSSAILSSDRSNYFPSRKFHAVIGRVLSGVS